MSNPAKNDEDIDHINDLPFNELKPNFQKPVRELCALLFDNPREKLLGGVEMNGPGLV